MLRVILMRGRLYLSNRLPYVLDPVSLVQTSVTPVPACVCSTLSHLMKFVYQMAIFIFLRNWRNWRRLISTTISAPGLKGGRGVEFQLFSAPVLLWATEIILPLKFSLSLSSKYKFSFLCMRLKRKKKLWIFAIENLIYCIFREFKKKRNKRTESL